MLIFLSKEEDFYTFCAYFCKRKELSFLWILWIVNICVTSFSFSVFCYTFWVYGLCFCLLDWPVVLVRICNSSTQKVKTGIVLLIPYIVYQELHNAKQGILGFMIKHYLKIQSKEEGRISIFWLVIAVNISP